MKLSIDANNVSAENQLADTAKTKYHIVSGEKKRIAMIGNSITLHGIKEDIGWHGEWGMAASCKEKDYCHLIIHDYRKDHPDTSFMICQAADWEINFDISCDEYPEQLRAVLNFAPDIVVLRLGENCRREYCEEHDFDHSFMQLCEYLGKNGAKLIITNSFWYSPWTDEGIKKATQKCDGLYVELSDLGDMDEMKAIGLFEHSGVAAHPGDKGMRAIADRILEALLKL